MFFNRKKKLAKKMITGVDLIKLSLFQTMKSNIKEGHQNLEDNAISSLSAVLVNEIFGCHTDQTQSVFEENEEILDAQLKVLPIKNPDLIQPLTDSLRVYVQANQMLGSAMMENHEYVMLLFKKAIDRGIFNKAGNHPEPNSFLEMANKIAAKYHVI